MTNDPTTTTNEPQPENPTEGQTSVANEPMGQQAQPANPQPQGEGHPEGAGVQEAYVVDAEGKEYVPREVLKKRIDAITAEKYRIEQEYKAKLAQLEGGYRSQERELEHQQVQNPVKASGDIWSNDLDTMINERFQGSEAVAPFKEVLQAFGKTVRESILASIGERIKPLETHHGQTVLSQLRSRYPDFTQYEDRIFQEKRSGNPMHPEAIYKMLAYDELVKRSQIPAQKPAQQPPPQISVTSGNPMPAPQKAPQTTGTGMSFRDAVREAALRTGLDF